MRHRRVSRRFGRTSAHRQAMFQNMMNSLLIHGMIKTTLPKAKDLRRLLEPLVTLAKEDSVAKRRLAFDRLRNKEVVSRLFSNWGPQFKERPGGYLRILKCGQRAGDAAPMAVVTFVAATEQS